MSWQLDMDTLALIVKIELICPHYGCHVALTGGVLYKEDARKDLDLLIYRIRQKDTIDYDGLFKALESELKIKKMSGFGWCYKLQWEGKRIDLFDPEEAGGEPYPEP